MSEAHPTTWTQDGSALPPRPVADAMLRGLRMRCPACGGGSIFRAYLKVNDACPTCGEALHHHRADDAPPYFTIVIVGHIVVPLVLTVERMFAPAIWLQASVWTLITVALCMMLLPPIKGALVGLQWANYMHGFDPRSGGREDWDGMSRDTLSSPAPAPAAKS
ncbi:DUF983 domain-containing protein [Microbaculum marinisediminis]|uniref:DUF983 domain-containing protein n=1 Tax=Microbaculum marinisediminis TaxID=2931392 RepID=A0AAW5R1I2_9HYPH|nr:DUF983 domain-containing protein [Microbaculum sp. A6E488]MCT8973180.1 DUF983 domain-containing protein [Microbaculum sp. A6E488]